VLVISIFWNPSQAHKKFEKISSTCFKIENNDGTLEEHPQFKDARFDAIQKAVQAYDNNPASGPELRIQPKISVVIFSGQTHQNWNHSDPYHFLSEKV